MYNNYYWRSFIALQDEILGGADEEHIIYACALALGSKFMMETFLSLAIRYRDRVRHFVHVAMFRIPPFHVRNARAINVSS